MTSEKHIKQMANVIRYGRSGESYYERYSDVSVADLLLVLEDENYHSYETLVEALMTLDFGLIEEATAIAHEHNEAGALTQSLSNRRQELDKVIREGK